MKGMVLLCLAAFVSSLFAYQNPYLKTPVAGAAGNPTTAKEVAPTGYTLSQIHAGSQISQIQLGNKSRGDGRFWIETNTPTFNGKDGGVKVTAPSGWCIQANGGGGIAGLYTMSFDYDKGTFVYTAGAKPAIINPNFNPVPSANITFSFYDKYLDLAHDQAVYLYLQIVGCKNGTKGLLRLGGLYTYSANASKKGGIFDQSGTGSIIMLTRNTAGANTVDSKPVVTDGKADFGLSIKLQSQLKNIVDTRGSPNICSLSVTYVEGKQTIQLVKPSEKKDSSGKVIACTGKLPSLTDSIPVKFPVKPVGTGDTTVTFTASVKANISSNTTQQVVVGYTTPALKVNYNAQSGVVNEVTSGHTAGYENSTNNPAPLPGTSAVSSSNAEGTSTFDRCYNYFEPEGFAALNPFNWGKLALIGVPVCSVLQVIVTAASTLASYAINYFLKPAIGLT